MSKIPLKSKTDLLSMIPDDLYLALSRHFSGRGQPDYRAGQVKSWLYQGLVNHFSEMTNVPLEERMSLVSGFEIDLSTPKMVQVSQDSTVKHLWTLKDGELIESVLIPTDRRLTLCLSLIHI